MLPRKAKSVSCHKIYKIYSMAYLRSLDLDLDRLFCLRPSLLYLSLFLLRLLLLCRRRFSFRRLSLLRLRLRRLLSGRRVDSLCPFLPPPLLSSNNRDPFCNAKGEVHACEKRRRDCLGRNT
jgi:hypothetical protein